MTEDAMLDILSNVFRDGQQKRFRIVESVPDKDGVVIIGVKEDPDGAFVSREKALEYIQREHAIRTKSKKDGDNNGT